MVESAKGSWDSRFTLPPGLDGPAAAVVSVGNFLLVGGAFEHAGNVEAHNLALWDGRAWMPFGGGLNGPVASMVLDGTGLYVAGNFTKAGGVSVQGIARWNGMTWDGLNANPQGVLNTNFLPQITSLFFQGGNLYVAGGFVKIGGISSTSIARWDGRAWHSMEGGVSGYGGNGSVLAIVGDGRNIYAGGQFTQAGSVQANNLARWNGQHWERAGDFATKLMGGGQPQPQIILNDVERLAFCQGTLYAFGQFNQVDGNAITNFAKWNGTKWQSAGTIDGTVNGMDEYMGGLLVAGSFHHIGGVTATNVAWLRQGKWSSLGVNTAGSFYGVKAVGNRVYLAGYFDLVSGVSAGNIVQYDGAKYSALGAGTGNSIGGMVQSLASDGTNVFAAGNFDVAGTLPVSGVAKWDGTRWSSLGKPFYNGNVYGATWFGYGYAGAMFAFNSPQVAMVGSKLYLSGQFEMPDVGATNLACWDDREWSSVDGVTGDVASMVSDGKKLYVSGTLSFSSSDFRSGVNAWDGTNWTVVPGGSDLGWPLLAVDGTNLYMAKGRFSRTLPVIGIGPGNPSTPPIPPIPPTPLPPPPTITPRLSVTPLKVYTVAKWDGQTFTDFGEIPGIAYVNALAAQGNTIYVAGYSTNYNGTSELFRWDGNAWEQVAVPFEGRYSIESIVLKGQKIYLGGYFTTANGILVEGLKEWDGFSWKNLGISDGFVGAMVASGNKLFVGGKFSTVAGTRSGNFGIWTEGR